MSFGSCLRVWMHLDAFGRFLKYNSLNVGENLNKKRCT